MGIYKYVILPHGKKGALQAGSSHYWLQLPKLEQVFANLKAEAQRTRTELPGNRARAAVERVLEGQGLREYSLHVSGAVSKGDNFLGTLYRTLAEGRGPDDEPAVVQMILKMSPTSASVREKFPVETIYKREVFAYTRLLPELCKAQEESGINVEERFECVKCFLASSEAPHEMLILQDIRPLGFEMLDRQLPLNLAHLQLAVKSLAHFHALSFYVKCKRPERFATLAAGLETQLHFGREISFLEVARDRAITILEDQRLIDKVRGFAGDLYDRMAELISPDQYEPYTVLCHGDCWSNNMLFKYENGNPVDVRFLDWQIMHHASPVTDLACLICTSTDEELRRNHFHRILNLYYGALSARLHALGVGDKGLYPEEVFRQQVRAAMPLGLVVAFMLLPAITSEEGDTAMAKKMMNKEKIVASDMKLSNEKSSQRYEQRMRGIIRDFARMEFI